MDNLNVVFLKILKFALCGQANFEYEHKEKLYSAELEEISLEQWIALFQLAQKHKVLPLIYESVYALPQLQSDRAPFMSDIRQQVVHQVMLQAMKTEEFLKLNKFLLESGIKPLVVKGVVCRNLYPMPEHRQSNDEDVLIESSELGICHRLLEEYGLFSEDDGYAMQNNYEVSYRKEQSPLYIELHKLLFPNDNEWNRFFKDAFSRSIKEEIQGYSVWTLGYTDHLFYLICHAFKHFINSGFGIRQVCDIVMFANAYGDKINWSKVLIQSRQIKAYKFVAAIFKIGTKYLNFDSQKACYPKEWGTVEVDETPMLNDLLSAGIYGSSTMSRKHSSTITMNAVFSDKKGVVAKPSLRKTIFPSAEVLSSRYSYLHTKPFLLPIAWISRMIGYTIEIVKVKGIDNSATEAIKIGSERIQLLKEYEII